MDIINGHTEDNNWCKYLTLITVDENKGEIKKYKETLNKIKYFIELENNDLGRCDGKYIKIRFEWDNNLLLK